MNQSSALSFDPSEHPHRRRNLLNGDWVLVSPHRTARPWQGQVERPPQENLPSHDPTCYLCPGNERMGGHVNPAYDSTFVFTNDFAALLADSPSHDISQGHFFQAEAETGTCRVICFSPRHDLTLAQMDVPDIRQVVDVWAAQTTELGNQPGIGYVQLFENRGAVMGSSNPHPHGQVWANRRVPTEPALEDREQRLYFERHNQPLLLDYLHAELEAGERVVLESKEWVVVVPYWAVWPFETLVLPRSPVLDMPGLNDPQRDDLAGILKQLLVGYDNLFETSFPYSMGWHGQPTDGGRYPHWQLHAHWYPPLLRSATVRKFMVGYELLGEAQRDITPEQAACRLREVSERHYKEFPGVVARQA